LKIERQWHREPGWFSTLDKATQVKLIAAYRAEMMPHKAVKQKRMNKKQALIRQKVQAYAERDKLNG
jgi:hypothetical protein